MKRTALFIAAACLCIGCGRGGSSVATTSSLSGPIAHTSKTPTAAGGTIIEFECSPIRVEKGKTIMVAVSAKRKDAAAVDDKKQTAREGEMYKETYYQGDIQLEFDGSDAGLKIAPVVIPAGQEKTEATVTANADAAGGFVEVTGKGANGADVKPVTIRIRADVR